MCKYFLVRAASLSVGSWHVCFWILSSTSGSLFLVDPNVPLTGLHYQIKDAVSVDPFLAW